MKSEPTIWIRPHDIELVQSVVLERLSKERGATLMVRGELAELTLPKQFERPESGLAGASKKVFDLNHRSWRLLQGALRKEDWLSERLLEMQIMVDGELAFLVGDSFHPECVSLRQAAPRNLARKLVEAHAAVIYES